METTLVTPEHHERVGRLFRDALELPAGERSSFLSKSCDGDAVLQGEVESLLSYEAVSDAAIDGSAMEAVSRVMAVEQSHSWVGRQVSHYQVLSRLGGGGMGEVYRARDHRLGRDVAIKALPLAFATDSARMRRFEEEARTVGQLNHPNIVALYDIGVHDGAPFIVTEMLNGEDLRQQLNRGALPQRRAIDYGQQIARGLAATHARGIVHRDLKPENLLVTSEGCVKILDFGLAKLADATAAGPSVSTERLETSPGFIVGTIGYLAPEQLRGERADHRADVFAFGVILHEMLSGRRPFECPSPGEIVAAILKDEPPDLDGVTGQITLNRIVRRCLEKDPEQRFQSARDLAFALDLLSTPSSESAGAHAPPFSLLRPARTLRMSRWATRGAVLLTSVLIAAISAVAAWNTRRVQPQPAQVARFVLPVPGGTILAGDLEVSRDGAFLAYSTGRPGARTLFVRRLSAPDAEPVAAIEGGEGPFFSPDSEWLGFFADGKMQKISMRGGTPITLADAPSQRGADWGEGGSIVFAPIARAGLFLVSENGGVPEALTTPDEERLETGHIYPRWLPGGRHLFYVARREIEADRAIVAFSLEDRRSRVLLAGNAVPRYLSSGHLTFLHRGNLMAVPFSVDRLEPTGTPTPAVERVATYAVSETGLLMYAPVNTAPGARLVWVDRQGQTTDIAAPVRDYRNPRLSPDGGRVAVAVATAQQSSIWIFDLVRDALVRLTFEGQSGWPVWSRNGREVIFASNRSGTSWDIYRKSTDGTGVEASILVKPLLQIPHAVSDEGGQLALTEIGPSSFHTAMLSMRDGALNVRVKNAWTPSLSPDARWFAYTSNEAGRYQIYVRPSSGAEGRWQISTEGGVEPVWSASGSELFYRHGDQVLAVDVVTNSTFEYGKPRRLFEGRYALGNVKDDTRAYDVAPDGQRFLMLKTENEPSTGDLKVVVNWYDELRRLGLTDR
jgi:eukaryotic-like serine/threonine-protein kinase